MGLHGGSVGLCGSSPSCLTAPASSTGAHRRDGQIPRRPAGSTACPLLSVSFAADSRLLLGVEGAAHQPTSASHAAGIYGEVFGVEPTAPTRAGHFAIAYDWGHAAAAFRQASPRGLPAWGASP